MILSPPILNGSAPRPQISPVLTRAGLPTPGGFALTADAYRHQLRHLGIEDLLQQYNEADCAGLAPDIDPDQAGTLREVHCAGDSRSRC